MNTHSNKQVWLVPAILLSLTTFKFSNAEQTPVPMSELTTFYHFLNTTSAGYQWMSLKAQSQDSTLKLSPPVILAGILSFIAATISSAGGIGGGGLFIPILTIVARLDLKTASSFSAFMVTGGSVANVACGMLGGKTSIDYDIALLSQPFMLLGVSIGVICNVVFPEWLITILFAVFLAWCTFKTFRSGVKYWKLETQRLRKSEMDLAVDDKFVRSAQEPLLGGGEVKPKLDIPWMKLFILVVIWFSFFVLYLLRGNRYGQGIIPIKVCGVAYWVISSLQIPLAIVFTAWMLCSRGGNQNQTSSNNQDTRPKSKLMVFPVMAFLAGLLGGVFGIGGGMLISPLLLQVGIAPEVTAATCSLMVLFSSTMSAFEYLLLGMEQIHNAVIFAIICFFASLIGLVVVQRAIEKHGRASLIVFSVGTVMALSTVLITSFGALDVWRDYISGSYMGFKRPC